MARPAVELADVLLGVIATQTVELVLTQLIPTTGVEFLDDPTGKRRQLVVVVRKRPNQWVCGSS